MSGGGTGGHIFPAIAIAQEIRQRFPEAEFLFIGANGKMEMEKVPQAGFPITGLPIAGVDRGSLLKNISLPWKLVKSLVKARRAIARFHPDVAIGTGGFASGPALYIASVMGVPTFVQEQNSLPGKTNLLLAKKAAAVFTAYPDMDRFFPQSTTHFLGNPVRQDIISGLIDTREAKQQLGLDPQKLTILSVGGSLGSRTLNKGWKENVEAFANSEMQLIWQTGKLDFEMLRNDSTIEANSDRIQVREFISDMALAYSAADIIVSRAGAIAISELALAKKSALLVPFPFAAEDHQTKNARALVDKGAAKMVTDAEMPQKFWRTLTELTENEELRREMSNNLQLFAMPDATQKIVDVIVSTLKTESTK